MRTISFVFLLLVIGAPTYAQIEDFKNLRAEFEPGDRIKLFIGREEFRAEVDEVGRMSTAVRVGDPDLSWQAETMLDIEHMPAWSFSGPYPRVEFEINRTGTLIRRKTRYWPWPIRRNLPDVFRNRDRG